MISNKNREIRRVRTTKMSKNIERLYKEGKCSECSVIVTPMDFAKILGKFTKVKIQYESGSSRNKKGAQQTSPNTNSRLKSNENGMVLIHRKVYNQHPANLLKPSKAKEKSVTRVNNTVKEKKVTENSSPQANNILKENNRLKRTTVSKSNNYFQKNDLQANSKRYGIIFLSPDNKTTENKNGNLLLKHLLPSINKNILPSGDWGIDYLPKLGEPKEDKVYDRIAAELEDLMNNEKTNEKSESKSELFENKDDFPSIMDILNDNTISSNPVNNQSNQIVQANLESSDVEAMLLGKTSEASKPTPMEVDNSVISNLIGVVEMNTDPEEASKPQNSSDIMDNPNSPSILDETLLKGVEEHLPKVSTVQENRSVAENPATDNKITETAVKKVYSNIAKNDGSQVKNDQVTHVVFKKCVNGICTKSVTCPKNLKYTIELEGKTVEFLGAPKFISCPEDLQVLLQIVNDTELSSLYVLH